MTSVAATHRIPCVLSAPEPGPFVGQRVLVSSRTFVTSHLPCRHTKATISDAEAESQEPQAWPPRGAAARGDGGCDALGPAAWAHLFPDPTPVSPAGDVIAGARDVTLHTNDGLDLGAWFVPATGPVDTRLAVLVAPGNGGNRAGRPISPKR